MLAHENEVGVAELCFFPNLDPCAVGGVEVCEAVCPVFAWVDLCVPSGHESSISESVPSVHNDDGFWNTYEVVGEHSATPAVKRGEKDQALGTSSGNASSSAQAGAAGAKVQKEKSILNCLMCESSEESTKLQNICI